MLKKVLINSIYFIYLNNIILNKKIMTVNERGLLTKILQTSLNTKEIKTIRYSKIKFNSTSEIVLWLSDVLDLKRGSIKIINTTTVKLYLTDDLYDLTIEFEHVRRGRFLIISTKEFINDKAIWFPIKSTIVKIQETLYESIVECEFKGIKYRGTGRFNPKKPISTLSVNKIMS